MISLKYKNKMIEKVLKSYKAEKFKKIISEFRLHSLFSISSNHFKNIYTAFKILEKPQCIKNPPRLRHWAVNLRLTHIVRVE